MIIKVTGQTPMWFRPPGGYVSPDVTHAAQAQHMRLVLWTVDPQDWRNPPTSEIVRRVLAQAKPGGVVLMHDGGGTRAHTIAALPTIIKGLKARGYTFVTLDQLYSIAQ
jgi:peptidoglycan-N-acetylglucosamine deacetylase